MRIRFVVIVSLLLLTLSTHAQVMQQMDYTDVYSLLEELASDHIIEINPQVMPYNRRTIATKLAEAYAKDSLLTKRQHEEVAFYCNEYALELDTLPTNYVQYNNGRNFSISLAQPSIHVLVTDSAHSDKSHFTMSIKPVLGAIMRVNSHGYEVEHHWGAEVQMDICNHLAIWGKVFDEATGNRLQAIGERIRMEEEGLRMKEGGRVMRDRLEATGGIAVYDWFGSIGFQKEKIRWGHSQASSIILSGNAPSVPMVTLHLTPVRWFEFNYFHAWLIPDAMDTTFFPSTGETYIRKHKYMAANMFTFMPIPHLEFSAGNSIIYAEDNVQAAYLIPIAFYKSLDHLLTKGAMTQNQNSELFFTFSTRNLKYLYLYGSCYIDEINFKRLKKDNPETNPITFQVGAQVTNWPIDGLRIGGEFMRSYIGCYNNMVNVLWYTSGEQYLATPLGDNSQNIHAEVGYRPIRGLDIAFTFRQDTRYNPYHVYYKNQSIKQKSFKEKVWQDNRFTLQAKYEFFNNCFVVAGITYNDAWGGRPTSEPVDSEDRGQTHYKEPVLTGDALAEYYLNQYSSALDRGRNWTFNCGLYYNF